MRSLAYLRRWRAGCVSCDIYASATNTSAFSDRHANPFGNPPAHLYTDTHIDARAHVFTYTHSDADRRASAHLG